MGVELDCCTVEPAAGLASGESRLLPTESVRSWPARSIAASTAADSVEGLAVLPALRRVRRCSGNMLAKLEPGMVQDLPGWGGGGVTPPAPGVLPPPVVE